MGRLIYVEEDLLDHPRTRAILGRFKQATIVPCHHYSEIFNRKAQNFRLQKRRPALILARKNQRFVMPAPNDYAIGARENYYFSHMLNCPYDCRYCFLQGMYRSAHYLLFVNFEDFGEEIERTTKAASGPIHFFSGYDSDSLAYDGISGFLDYILPVFARLGDRAGLELRTKCARIEPLLKHTAPANCIVAFSFTPEAISKDLEHGVPALQLRLRALSRLAKAGWRIGLRFDPLIHAPDFQDQYRVLFNMIFDHIPADEVHSVSLGGFRLPEGFHGQMARLYPDEALFHRSLVREDGMVSYPRALETDMIDFCQDALTHHMDGDRIFPCRPQAQNQIQTQPAEG